MKSLVLCALVAAISAEPVFKPTKIRAPFIEQFTDGWDNRWKPSEATKQMPTGFKEEDGNADELFRYRGEWAVEEALKDPLPGKKGLVAKNAAAHHAISVAFPKVVDPNMKDLVIQYELKNQQELECGGAYIKLLTESPDGINFKEFDDKTPYTIMFGPDKCGATNKVHFIYRFQNPVSKEWHEHHFKNPGSIKAGDKTNVYTLAIHPNNTFEIYTNLEKAKSGNLLEDFDPPVNPEKEIVDKDDVKPEDWEDEAKIPDPDAVKPDDWDEDAPKEIPDEDAVKPDTWLDNEREYIEDPEAIKPEYWNDEEDGGWVAPMIPNPKCEEFGCGKWVRPMKANPDYKGKWYPPMIDNPNYKGAWVPKKVKNPHYFHEEFPSRLSKIMGIGIEIWTMQPNIMFDSFYVGHNLEDAFQLAKESWALKKEIEDAKKESENVPEEDDDDEEEEEEVVAGEEQPVEKPVKKPKSSKKKKGDFLNQMMDLVKEFVLLAASDPVKAFKRDPITGVFIVFAFLIPSFLYLLLSGPMKQVDQVGKRKKEDISTPDDKEDEKDE